MTTRLQAMRHRDGHRRRARRGRRDRAAGAARRPLRLPPASASARRRRKSPITPFRPSALSTRAVDRTATDFARSVGAGAKAGYDAVEIMGSEGYLINQFLAARTNDRTDALGRHGREADALPASRSCAAPRELVGDDFPIVYRISLLDLVEGGQTWDEVVELAHRLEAGRRHRAQHRHRLARGAGARRSSPRSRAGAWRSATARLKAEVSVPVCASNRINTPELAEEILAAGEADLVSMARPLLADPDFVAKAAAGRADEINTCIACNQACLDHVFANQKASCLVNPRACRETELVLAPDAGARRRVAVVGAGPAGLAAAVSAAERGFAVTLFEKSRRARRPVPAGDGRSPARRTSPRRCATTRRRLEVLGVDVRLGTRGHRRRPRGVRRGGRRHRRRAAACPSSTASTTRAWCRTPTCSAARSSRASGSP